MIASQDRHRSKSARRIRIKSPLNIGHKISLQEQSQQKITLKKSKQSNSDSTDSERKAFIKNYENTGKNQNSLKNWASTGMFKNKITIPSGQFNRLKQKLQSNTNQGQGPFGTGTKKVGSKKLKIKILDGLSKQTSNNSDKSNPTNKSGQSSDSQQIELLKVENEYFKKIYDEAMAELSKLKNKLKQEKKVHQVEKQIYQNQIHKLKRIIDYDRQQVSHIICDQDNRYIIVVSSIDKNKQQDELLAIYSDCEEQIGDLSLQSRI